MKRWLLLLILSANLSLISAQSKMTAQEYIDKYKHLAIDEMKRTGIPASITLAQGLVESGNGNSYLAREAKNHFGIKCRKDWKGRSVSATDDAPDECFRAYGSVEESYRDHSDFLVYGQRYAFLFELKPDDYKAWAEGLKKAGYATNPRYPDMLISVIERYELYEYDKGNKKHHEKEHKPDAIVHKDKNNEFQLNGIPAYIVKPGDSYRSITDAFGMMHWQLRKYNELSKGEELIPGTVLYLKPKNRKADKKHKTYKVTNEDNMYLIAQKNGIKLKRLYKLNRMEKGSEAAVGEVLNLRKKRKSTPKLNNQNPVAVHALIIKPEVSKPENKIVNSTPDTEKVVVKNTPETPVDTEKKVENPIVPQPPKVDVNKEFHIVAAGETIYFVSKTYQVSIEDLLTWNNVPDSLLRIGQIIRVKPPKNAQNTNNTVKKPVVNKTFSNKENKADSSIYIVSAGETLYAISKKTNISVDDLKRYNSLTENSVNVGQKLVLYDSTVNNVPKKPLEKTKEHIVKTGETLYSIARQYNMSVEKLKTLNNLTENSLRIGQKLLIIE